MAEKILDFREKDIRLAILNKASPRRINKSGKHWKGYIYWGDILITKVKIPNNHDRIMKHGKSQYICRDLKLDPDQFNSLVNCTMTGADYYNYLEAQK